MDNCTNYLILRHFHVVIPNPSLVWISPNSLQYILDTPIYFGLVQIWTYLYPFKTNGKIDSQTYLPLNFKQGSEHLMRVL